MDNFFDVGFPEGERCALIVNKRAIAENAKYIVRTTGKKLIAVVKANAYGHGMCETVDALGGIAAMFAVATAEEALEVCRCGAKALLLTPQDGCGMRMLAGKNVSVAIEDKEAAEEAAKLGIPVHIAVDTGMGRFGVNWRDVGTLLGICDVEGLVTEGVFTHFPCADAEDISPTVAAAERFASVVNVLGKRRFGYVHCAASAAALRGVAFGNAVRVGLALYGVCPDNCNAPLNEVSRLYARLISSRLVSDGESVGYGAAYTASGIKRIAVIGAGYADGLPYSAKNHGSVLVNGTYCDIVGNVCMDSAFIDATYSRVQKGDVVCVLGGDGDVGYRAAARKTGQIPYRILTGIPARVKRVYV